MREGHKQPSCIIASALGLTGVLLCLLGLMRPVNAGDARTLQVWPDRSVGVSTGLLAGPAPYTATQVFPMGVSSASDGDAVHARTYLHFPLDVFPPGTEILRATLHVYVDSGSGIEDATLGAYRVLDPWEEGDLGHDPAAWPTLLDTPLAVTVARLDDVSALRPVLPASTPTLTATSTLAATSTTTATETSRSLSRPAGHARSQQGTSVIIDLQSSQVEVGATSTVDIRVEDVDNLYDVGLYVTFDPALLEVVDADSGTDGVQIEVGTFLGTGEVGINEADNEYGVIDFTYWPDGAVNGSGTLVTIIFRGKAAGESEIAISDEDCYLLDYNDDLIDADFSGDSITVTEPTPEPTNTPPPGATLTPTPSATPTSSSSPLDTPTLTVTPSPGPTLTATSTPRPTSTSSASPLSTPTLTPAPTPGPPAATAVLALGEVEGTWLTWDVTALVGAWLAREVAGYGVAVASGPAPDADPDTAGDLLVARWFTADDPTTRPYVIAEFRVHPTTPTPTAAYGPVLPPAGGSGGVRVLGVLFIGAALVILGLLARKM